MSAAPPVPAPAASAPADPPRWAALSRGVALALGLFCLVNAVGDWLRPGFDASLWLLDLRPLPPWLAQGFLLALTAALLFIAAGLSTRRPPPGRRFPWALAARSVVWTAAGLSLLNVLRYYRLLHGGAFSTDLPLPLSLAWAAGFTLVALGRGGGPAGPPLARALRWGRIGLVTLTALVAAALGQMTCFGLTDYRTEAEVAVVLGARAYPNGALSNALEDRTEAAVQLYQAGLVHHLIFSGGPVAGAGPDAACADEPAAMRLYALKRGVPDEAILLDPQGVDTEATAVNTARMIRGHGWKRALAVSHFYHLPRCKLTFARQGLEVRTVPASMRGQVLRRLPRYMLREVVALGKDWLWPARRGTPAAR